MIKPSPNMYFISILVLVVAYSFSKHAFYSWTRSKRLFTIPTGYKFLLCFLNWSPNSILPCLAPHITKATAYSMNSSQCVPCLNVIFVLILSKSSSVYMYSVWFSYQQNGFWCLYMSAKPQDNILICGCHIHYSLFLYIHQNLHSL